MAAEPGQGMGFPSPQFPAPLQRPSAQLAGLRTNVEKCSQVSTELGWRGPWWERLPSAWGRGGGLGVASGHLGGDGEGGRPWLPCLLSYLHPFPIILLLAFYADSLIRGRERGRGPQDGY